ncbi:multiple sugar transport system permease protein [Palleronia aestuarii]|uniref:Multiple sugar transport system permease protein n=1 Tax=Palleronia aestuarii TaxID=568105 RepID=A0A2W7N448_9RHOB|nr:sugar ABC transporter permease [Palleronia aestuarii]PZX14473.1 multiple sugar transport system permease protein [Palleronia aestuarii]
MTGSTADLRARRRAGLLLAAPAALLLALLLFLPSSGVLVLSLTDYRFGMPGASWIGLENYARMLADDRIRQSLGNTALYAAIVAPVSILLALWLAVLIEATGRLGGFFRTVFFLPVTATLVAMATAWEVVLHPSFGMVNVALAASGLEKERFLSDPSLALYTLAFIGVWKMVGYNVLLFVAGLSTIPKDLYEAAAIDGADRGWSRFAMVTWPMLAPVTLFVTVITLIRTVSEFETIAVLTNGGPNGATEMVLYTLYQEAFRYFDIGLASALAVCFLGIVAGASILNIVLFDRRSRHG